MKRAPKSIPITELKANCGAVVERVRKTRKPVVVTRFGKPVAEIVPAEPAPEKAPALKQRKLGGMEGTARILGDIVSPWTWAKPLR
jgi:prevent-host-death family protein